MTVLQWLGTAWMVLVGLLMIVCGISGIGLGRRLRRPAPKPVAPPVNAVADMVETKAAIRKDERRRWAEAWQYAADLPDLATAVQEIREVEYRAVRAFREHRLREEETARLLAHAERQRRYAEEVAARRLEAEQRQAEQTARADQERAAAAAARKAEEAHQAHLAARRARYAQRRKNA